MRQKEILEAEVRELTHKFEAAKAGAEPGDPAGEHHPRGSIVDQV